MLGRSRGRPRATPPLQRRLLAFGLITLERDGLRVHVVAGGPLRPRPESPVASPPDTSGLRSAEWQRHGRAGRPGVLAWRSPARCRPHALVRYGDSARRARRRAARSAQACWRLADRAQPTRIWAQPTRTRAVQGVMGCHPPPSDALTPVPAARHTRTRPQAACRAVWGVRGPAEPGTTV